MENIFYYQTVIGKIAIAEKDGKITNLFFETDSIPKGYTVKETRILKEANKQLEEYFVGQRKSFSLDFDAQGTKFMRSVWKCLQDIPYGAMRSYQEVARLIGNDKACRAVGLANNKNPLPIFIPCHRVIGADGKLTGYRGGVQTKRYLLDLEKS